MDKINIRRTAKEIKQDVEDMPPTRLLGELVAGLQAPYSVSPRILGIGGVAWLELNKRAGIVGWVDGEEAADKIRSLLMDEWGLG